MINKFLCSKTKFLAVWVAFVTFAAFNVNEANACNQRLNSSINYLVLEQNVDDVARAIASRANMQISTIGSFNAKITRKHIRGSAESALNNISSTYGLSWWCEGNSIVLSASADRKQCVFKNNEMQRDVLINTLAGLGIDRRNLYFGNISSGLYVVSGPVQLMNNVINTANQIQTNSQLVVYRGGNNPSLEGKVGKTTSFATNCNP